VDELNDGDDDDVGTRSVVSCRLLKHLDGAGEWRDDGVKFVNSISSLMQKLLDYRYAVLFHHSRFYISVFIICVFISQY